MKKLIALSAFCIACATQLQAQRRTNDQDIQDSVIGWWSNNRFDHLKPQTDPLNKKKEACVNDMVKWMKTSYTPVGGLGTSSRYIRKTGYGVSFLVWSVSHDKEWTDPDGSFRPIAEENTQFLMAANQIFGSFPISFINTGNEFYFTLQPDGYLDNTQTKDNRKNADPRIHPNAYNYVTIVNDWCTVYLTPNNKLPWTPVTKGELLQKAEEGLEKVLNDKTIEEYKKRDIEKYRANIRKLREKHSSSLNEPAIIRDMQPTMYSFEPDPDLFRIDDDQAGLKHAFPVYKLDAATNTKMTGETPLWVAMAFPYESKERGNQLYEMFTAMAQNINYDYIFNYFYNPEKIKGKPYTATNADGLKDRLDNYRKTTSKIQSTLAKKQAGMPANVVLFDDFSQESLGSKPAGWFFNSYGQAHTIAKVQGETGNWLKLGYNNKITPTTLKTLPGNFSMEYDIVTSNFDGRWGAGITMEMSGSNKGANGIQQSSNLEIKITAGNQAALEAAHDYRGQLQIRLTNTPTKMDYNERGGRYEAAQPVFTSTKRKVHFQLIKKGDGLSILLNGKEFINSSQFKTAYGKPCGDCSIPAGIQYSDLSIRSLTEDPTTVDCYIGNIKITKL